MIEQFVPQEACLKCRGCCRFSEENSVWSPCLLQEEIQDLLDKKIPPASITLDKRIHPVPGEDSAFICPFLSRQENKCKIYEFRPFECRIYPFLICVRNKKAHLTVDLNCPYVREKLNSKEFKEYINYLTDFLNSPKQLQTLKDNPQIIQAYEEVMDIVELNLPNGA